MNVNLCFVSVDSQRDFEFTFGEVVCLRFEWECWNNTPLRHFNDNVLMIDILWWLKIALVFEISLRL